MNFRKNSKGITLIALVITIIVLLILAGVSLSLVTGSNGILGKASNAVNKTNEAQVKEEVELELAGLLTEYYWKDVDGTLFDYLGTELDSTKNYKTASGAKLVYGNNGIQSYIKYEKGQTTEMFEISENGSIKLNNKIYEIPENYTYTFKAGENVTAYVYPKEGTSGNEILFMGTGMIYINIYNDPTLPQWSCSYPSSEYNLVSLKISEGITGISDWSGFGNSRLENVELPDTLEYIGVCAFAGCNNLTNITIPSSVTQIKGGYYDNNGYFQNWTSAFYGWTSSQTIYVKGKTNPPSAWGSNWNGNAKVIWDKTLLSEGVPEDYLFSFKAGDNVTAYVRPISDNANELRFIGSGEMYNSLTYGGADRPNWGAASHDDYNIVSAKIDEGITSIGGYAFLELSKLAQVQIPDTVTSIGDVAFASCTSLTNITIPASVNSMGGAAFSGWTSSQTIHVKGKSSVPSGWSSAWFYSSNAQIDWDCRH